MILRIKIVSDDDNTRNYLAGQYSSRENFYTEDSGLDIYFPEDIDVPSRESKTIKLGIACEAFKNQEDKENGRNCAFYLYPRSSISRTPIRLANSVGIIDSGYRGELMVVVDNMNIGGEPHHIEKGKRLFQICSPDLTPFEHVEVVEELSSSERGHGGFGSTGN
jgi:dUTP pyrophosphatase